MIALDASGRVEAWNAAAQSLCGWTAIQTIGKPLPEQLFPPLEPGVSRVKLLKLDGSEADLELRIAARPAGGFLLVAVDRHPVLESESRFRDLLEAAPDAILEVDRQGRIVLANRVASDLFGYSREEILSMNVDDLVPDAARAAHARNRADYWKNPSTRPMGGHLGLSAKRRDGTSIPVEISLSPVETPEGFRVTAIIRDVTERRAAAEMIRAANQELEARNLEIQRADRLKSEFLASMSHELRTPLHTIIGFTELLAEELEGPLNEKQKRFLGHVHRDSVHLLELINDVLDLSKIESGRLELEIGVVDAEQLVSDTVESILPMAKAKNISVASRVEGPSLVMADRVRLREIFLNLLSNAVKFTPNGGAVTIESRPEERMVRFLVRDSGIGIALEDQAVVFDKFRQVSATTKGVREGTGLGLAIVKQLAELHGGTVALESAPGAGSCFSFTVPVEPDYMNSAPLVLIVEDEPAARELLSGYLHPLGIRTECAVDSAGAASLAARLRPDVIVLDLLMPGSSGWRVLSELRAAPETRATPVLVTSVLDRDAEALSLGATEYLQKPIQRETLLRSLRDHVPALRSALNRR